MRLKLTKEGIRLLRKSHGEALIIVRPKLGTVFALISTRKGFWLDEIEYFLLDRAKFALKRTKKDEFYHLPLSNFATMIIEGTKEFERYLTFVDD